MLFEEAKKLAKIIETAEGGCGGCVNEAVRELNSAFPAFTFSLVNPGDGYHASIDVCYRVKRAPVYVRTGCA